MLKSRVCKISQFQYVDILYYSCFFITLCYVVESELFSGRKEAYLFYINLLAQKSQLIKFY